MHSQTVTFVRRRLLHIDRETIAELVGILDVFVAVLVFDPDVPAHTLGILTERPDAAQ